MTNSNIDPENSQLIEQIMAAIQSGSRSKASKWDLTASGSIKSNYKNALIAVAEMGISAQRDTFADLVVVTNLPGHHTLASDQIGALRDTTLTFIRKQIQDCLEFDPGSEHLASAVLALAEDRRFNPLVDWLNGLEWDGTGRLSSWLPVVAGAEITDLDNAIGELLIKGLVSRGRYPGTKFDYCVVFEGPQGCGKSSLVKKLASGPGEQYFTDAPGLVGMDNKDRAELIAGKWIVELAELSGLNRGEVEGVKAFLTQVSDRYRPPYGRVAIDRLRTCVFVGTTNAKSYLSDNSGNRRFLPVSCNQVDLASLDRSYIQLIAEADHWLRSSVASSQNAGASIEPGRPLPSSFVDRHLTLPLALRVLAAERVDSRRHTDAMEEAVRAIVLNNGVTIQALADGRQFIASKDLMSALRDHLKSSVNGSGLAGWMSTLGWAAATEGPKTERVRGYAKLFGSP